MKLLSFKSNPDMANAILRIFIGLMFIAHGIGKVVLYGGISETVENFVHVKHFPAWSAYPSIFIEAIAGLMLVLGVKNRIAALSLMPITIGIIIYHFQFGWIFSKPNGGWEYPQFIFISLLTVFFIGEDKYSLSHKIFKK
ncbi:MAG: DoxX family protein [Bacteroidia bacterium]|nr:DoxX family protein [Bacteroidia bacterium]